MIFGYSTRETCKLILADEWFGYAESECFSTTNSLIQRTLIALNCLLLLTCRCSAYQISSWANQDICNQTWHWSESISPRFDSHYRDWRSTGNDGDGKKRISHQSTRSQHRYHTNAHGSMMIIIWTIIWLTWYGSTWGEMQPEWKRTSSSVHRYTSINIATEYLPEANWPWMLSDLCTQISMTCLTIPVTMHLQTLQIRRSRHWRRLQSMILSNHSRPSRRSWIWRGLVPSALTRRPHSCLSTWRKC